MKLASLQNEICFKLRIEKIFNSRVESMILSESDIKKLKSLYRKLIRRKKCILDLAKRSKRLGIELDEIHLLSNIDIFEISEVMQVLQRSLPFDEHRVKILFALSKTEIPQKVLIALKKSKNNFDFDKVLELIPPIFLFRNRVVKSSNYQIKTENSVRSISTGMRN